MARSDELAYTSAAELALLIRQRKLSPVEVVEAAIARIEARNPSITAFVHCGFEDARAAAKKAEDKVMAGDLLGPLHGVPVAIKDLFDFKAGWPATFGGIRAMKDVRVDYDGAYTQRMEEAGAIVLGMCNSPVMGFRGTCDNYLFGPSRNPFNLAHNTGGSSGGSAGAVADGMVPMAQGSDGGGSIRIPASCCGLYGYKQSFGRVPFFGGPNPFGSDTPFIFQGPLTRTVEDAALTLTATNGYHPNDPFALPGKEDYGGAIHRSIAGWRIAYSPDWDIFPVDPRVAQICRDALSAFEEAGARVEEVKVGINRSQQELSDLWCRLILPLNLQGFEGFKAMGYDLLRDHRDDLPPDYLTWMEFGETYTAKDYFMDQAIRGEVYYAIQALFETYDLIVSPTLACVPPLNSNDGDTKGPTEINGEAVDPLIGWCMTYLINYSGHPAASIPAGMAEGSLPVGLQIVGRRYADSDVLAASAAFERRRPWQDSYQICRDRSL